MAIGVEPNAPPFLFDCSGHLFEHFKAEGGLSIAAEDHFIKSCGIADLADQFLCGRLHPELQVVALYNGVIQTVAEGASGSAPVGQIQIQGVSYSVGNDFSDADIL